MDRTCFEQLFLENRARHHEIADAQVARDSINKVKNAVRFKHVQLMSELENNFLTNQGAFRKEISDRSLKHFLFKIASLPTLELDNLVLHFDSNHDGFVPITQLQTQLSPLNAGPATSMQSTFKTTRLP